MDEVDHQAGLLARGAAGDAADALLVDAPRGGRGEVHADRRPRRVPALGEQHRVAEHVDLAALERGEDLGQLALRRLAGDRAGVDPGGPERGGDVVGVPHAGGVDDAGNLAEARSVEVGDRDVEGLLVEQLGQLLLVEVLVHLAAAQRHLGDRPHPGPGRDADAAQRRDHAAARGLGEVEARGLGREEVGDVAGDQRAGRGHADEDRPGQLADAGAGLLAERGVRLVADHDRVGVGDAVGVADEPLVGLDGDRAVGVVRAVQQRRREAVLVAAVGDLADELVDEVAAVGEDQDPAGARGLDEAERGDGLAGAGRVLEPEAAAAPGSSGASATISVGRLLPVLGLLLVGRQRLVLLGDLFGARSPSPLSSSSATAGVASSPASSVSGWPAPFQLSGGRVLDLGGQRGEGAGEHVDLVLGQLGAVGQQHRLGVEQPLEPEQQRVLAPPLGEGVSRPASSSASAASTARRRAVPGARSSTSRHRAGSARA